MIDVNLSIIEQQILGIIKKNESWFVGDMNQKKSKAFILFCIATFLSISYAVSAHGSTVLCGVCTSFK